MNRWLLLRQMVLKEVRSLMRERYQLLGLLVATAIVIGNVAFIGMGLRRSMAERATPAPGPAATTAPVAPPGDAGPQPAPVRAPRPRRDPGLAAALAASGLRPEAVTRWAVVAVVTFLSLVLTTMFTTPMAVSAFVGEREAGTMELLLASPVPDGTLFWLKCAAVLLPTAAIAYALLGVGAMVVAALLGDLIALAPRGPLVQGVVMSLPVPLLLAGVLTGAGACASIRAQTTKGANQLIGIMLLLLFAPLALTGVVVRTLNLQAQFVSLLRWWINAPPAVQVGLLLAVPLTLAALLLGVARGLFNREKMLT